MRPTEHAIDIQTVKFARLVKVPVFHYAIDVRSPRPVQIQGRLRRSPTHMLQIKILHMLRGPGREKSSKRQLLVDHSLRHFFFKKTMTTTIFLKKMTVKQSTDRRPCCATSCLSPCAWHVVLCPPRHQCPPCLSHPALSLLILPPRMTGYASYRS